MRPASGTARKWALSPFALETPLPEGHSTGGTEGRLVAQTSRLRICLQCRTPGFNPWVGKTSWRRKWQPTPVFLPGESMDRGAWQAI